MERLVIVGVEPAAVALNAAITALPPPGDTLVRFGLAALV
jgi:hypothetical protein